MTELQSAFIARYVPVASDAHYAVLFTPAEQRTATAAAFAFFDTMRDLLRIQNDVAPTKVTWWHEEIARMRSGEPVHPICQPLVAFRGDALHEAMNGLLHGAVMDFNRVDVTDDTLGDYLRMRGGALHQMLHTIAGHTLPSDTEVALGQCLGIAQLMREARDPAFAKLPNAELKLHDGDSEAAVESRLRHLFNEAATTLQAHPPTSIPSHVHMALTAKSWPQICATEFGQTVPTRNAWRTLWTAWRAARRTQPQGSTT